MRSTRHFKDTKRNHRLREYASRKRPSDSDAESLSLVAELSQDSGNVRLPRRELAASIKRYDGLR